MKEALKLALEALKECRDRFFPLDQHETARDLSWGSVHSAVTKCEEALAQQDHSEQHLDMVKTQPAHRIWVGLTDEDCKGMSAGDKVVAMWADRTLKEKNT